MKKQFCFIILFSVFIASLFCEIKYIEIDSIKNVPVIEIKSIEDFEAIINEYGVRIGYLQKTLDTSLGNKKEYDGVTLYIIIDSVYFSFPMKGYLTLADYKNGILKKFENGSDYNKAISLGFESSQMYYYYRRNSFLSVDDCKDAFNNGFKNNDSRSSDSNAYYSAKKLGFSNYADYQEYLDYTAKGYASKTDWQVAKAKGFDKGSDYYTATENGFLDYSSFNTARGVGLKTNDDYQKFSQLVSSIERIMKEKNLEKKNAIIYFYIQNLPKGEMAISALSATLIESYKAQPENLSEALNLWYSDVRKEEEKLPKDWYENSRNTAKKITPIISLLSEKILFDFFNTTDVGGLGSYNQKSQIFKKK